MLESTATLDAAAAAFVREFLPQGVPSPHDLLYGDTTNQPAFAPSTHEGARCLAAFRALVARVAQVDPVYLLLVLPTDASELVVAYLARLCEGGSQPPRNAALATLISLHTPALEAFVETHGGLGHDALKRLRTIGNSLDGSADPAPGELPPDINFEVQH